MKHIRKRREPKEFVEWMRDASTISPPTYEDLAGRPKRAVMKSLLAEQGEICCYCMSRISSTDGHIEHFRPQKHYPELGLDYSNLHASCPGEHGETPGLHCGHAKEHNPARGSEEELLLVSPLELGCELFFRYSVEGEILPTEDPLKHKRAQQTISLLKLNEPNLAAQRSSALRAIINLMRTADFDDIEAEIALYQSRDPRKRFAPFCAAIVYVLKWAR